MILNRLDLLLIYQHLQSLVTKTVNDINHIIYKVEQPIRRFRFDNISTNLSLVLQSPEY